MNAFLTETIFLAGIFALLFTAMAAASEDMHSGLLIVAHTTSAVSGSLRCPE